MFQKLKDAFQTKISDSEDQDLEFNSEVFSLLCTIGDKRGCAEDFLRAVITLSMPQLHPKPTFRPSMPP